MNERPVDEDQPRTWQRFDDRTSTELELDDDQRTRLREIDERYDRELQGLGDDPMTNPRYNELNERRDSEVREVLNDDQYERWNQRNTGTSPAVTPAK